MADVQQFRLPDVGEGLIEAEILNWSVHPGERVVVNQVLVEVETAKAAVELPSPFAGVVWALHAQAGETVEVGRPLISIDIAPEASGSASNALSDTSSDTDMQSVDQPFGSAVLVGYGPRPSSPTRRARRPRAAGGATRPGEQRPASDAPSPVPDRSVVATPPIRKMARDLGVDLNRVIPTGPNGSVSRADVQATLSAGAASREERIPINGMRRATANAMVGSAFTAPHVSVFVTVDVTAMMELRQRVGARAEFSGVKVSPLLFTARAMLWAARRTPIVNSSWNEAAGEIVVKHYVNLGIAAATERGLIVPNIKAADQMSLRQLADALTVLTETARAGRSTPADMTGGTLTITNIGVFGIDAGTPILNPGESMILALGAVRRAPWVVVRAGVESIEARWITQLAVSFDHRVIDGAQGSAFLADVAAVLSDPALALL